MKITEDGGIELESAEDMAEVIGESMALDILEMLSLMSDLFGVGEDVPARGTKAYSNLLDQIIAVGEDNGLIHALDDADPQGDREAVKARQAKRLEESLYKYGRTYGWKFYIDYMAACVGYLHRNSFPRGRDITGAVVIEPYLAVEVDDLEILRVATQVLEENVEQNTPDQVMVGSLDFDDVHSACESVVQNRNQWAKTIQEAARLQVVSPQAVWPKLARGPHMGRDPHILVGICFRLTMETRSITTPFSEVMRRYQEGTLNTSGWTARQVAAWQEVVKSPGLWLNNVANIRHTRGVL